MMKMTTKTTMPLLLLTAWMQFPLPLLLLALEIPHLPVALALRVETTMETMMKTEIGRLHRDLHHLRRQRSR